MLGSCSSSGLYCSNRQHKAFSGHNGLSAHQQPLSPAKRVHVGTPRADSIRTSAAASGHVSDHPHFAGHQAILDRYRALLHEYRQHKAALGDWLSLITRTKQRQAQLLDAEATGDAALVSRFQQYLMIRKRLLAEIPLMREQLEEADQQQQLVHSSSSSGAEQQHRRPHISSSSSSTGSFGVVNANQASPVSKTQAVGQFFAAVNYRNKHGLRSSSSSSSSKGVESGSYMTSSGSSTAAAVAGASQLQAITTAAPGAGTATTVVASSPSSTVSSSSSSSSGVAVTGDSSGQKSEALSHLLSEATSTSSSTPSSGRATAAALAALAYKKQKQSGPTAVGSSSRGTVPHQQRPLAIQMAEAPSPPPGYAADGTRLDGISSSSVVIGLVETAKADANAMRSNRQLESDVSLEATLQGVPGGLGAADTAMFAATLTSQATAAAAGSSGDQTLADPVLAAAAAKASSSGSSEPVGEVVTAKFDVYSGRQRVMDADALDDYFASLVEGHSMQLAAAAAVNTSSSTVSDTQPQQQQSTSSSKTSSTKSENVQQKGNRRPGSGSSISGDLIPGLGLPADIIPLPT